MKGRPIRIDWDELEGAFNNKNEEIVYYLDTVTGHVHLEGEGEDDDFDEDDEMAAEAAPHSAGSGKDSTRLFIEPPDRETEIGWMSDFVRRVEDDDAETAVRLAEALGSEDPVNAFRDELRDRTEERDRWFLYRSEQIHQYIDSWLDANDIQPATAPPWR